MAARLDSDADALQWTLLVGVPLLIVLILSTFIMKVASGALSIWLTLVPFTAPAATMLRLPFGLPLWQVGVSAGLMLLCFAAAAWLAARTYRRHLVR